jgi:hypothetical protein
MPDALPDSGRHLLPARGAIRILILLGFFCTSFGLRLDGITSPPMEYHPVKQYRSAMVARDLYYGLTSDIPEWKRLVSTANVRELGSLVPPIMEGAAAITYRTMGHEALWVPRLMSVISWVAGGWFLYLIAMRITTPDAALISTAFYLFLPPTIPVSQSFQPDAPMVAATVASLLAILRYQDTPSWRCLIVAALTSALAVFLKAVALFFTLGAFFALALRRQGIRGLVSLQTLAFVLLSLVPTAIFYGDVIIQNSLGDHAHMGFSPHLLLQPLFWQLWLMKIQSFIGLTAFVVALTGILVVRDYRRTLLLSLWVAYLCYGVTKTDNIYTHDYYQLPLVPIAALSLGPSLALITQWLAKHRLVTPNRLAIASTAVALLLIEPLYLQDLPDRSSFRKEVAIAEAIGKTVHHSTNVTVLGAREERPLRYHGEFAGRYWPNLKEIAEDNETVEKHWLALEESRNPEYFVVRDQAEFHRQPELQPLLRSKYRVLEETADYLIFLRSHDRGVAQ